jgi:hypothetical protein
LPKGKPPISAVLIGSFPKRWQRRSFWGAYASSRVVFGVSPNRVFRRIFWLASGGKFFEGLVVFLTGVALSLIAKEFSLDASEKGFVSAAALAGILVGASGLGGLADHLGAKNSSSWKWGFSLSSSSP